MKTYKIKSVNRKGFYGYLGIGLIVLFIISYVVGIFIPSVVNNSYIFLAMIVLLSLLAYNIATRKAVKEIEIVMNSEKMIIDTFDELYFKDIKDYKIKLGINTFAKLEITSSNDKKYRFVTKDKYGDFSEWVGAFEELMKKDALGSK